MSNGKKPYFRSILIGITLAAVIVGLVKLMSYMTG